MKGYSIHLSHNTKQGSGYCLFPVPQTNLYQVIQKQHLNHPPSQIINDEWGNKVEVFRLNDVSYPISFYAHYTPTAIIKRINPVWNKEMYRNIKEKSLYLRPNKFMNGSDPKIQRLSQSIIKDEPRLERIIKKLYDYTLKTLSYGNKTKGLYTYKQALEEKTTDCGGYSNLLISLLQSVKIPCRLVVGHMVMPGRVKSTLSQIPEQIPCLAPFSLFGLTFRSFYMHVWVEVLLPNESWFPLDPSIEWQRSHHRTKSEGGFGHIPADRLVLSYGSGFTYTIEGKDYHVDLLQYPIHL